MTKRKKEAAGARGKEPPLLHEEAGSSFSELNSSEIASALPQRIVPGDGSAFQPFGADFLCVSPPLCPGQYHLRRDADGNFSRGLREDGETDGVMNPLHIPLAKACLPELFPGGGHFAPAAYEADIVGGRAQCLL